MISARRTCLALAVAVLAGSLVAATQGAASHFEAARVAAAGPPRCAVRVSIGPRVSPMTGEHAVMLVLTARAGRRCTLDGYPAIRLTANGRPLPFVYQHGGGPYVTARHPWPVVVRAGHPAYVLVAKYRCDRGDLVAATRLSVRLPGGRRWVTLQLGGGVEGLAYCKGLRRDPGNRVAVSPVEPSFTTIW